MWVNIVAMIFGGIAAIASLIAAVHIIKQKRMAVLSIIVLVRQGAWEYAAVKNTGEADAKNIAISFPKSMKIRYNNDALSAAVLSKGQQYKISFGPFKDEKNIQCDIEWDDKAGHHKKAQNIQIL